MNKSKLDYALDAAASLFPVFPVEENGKRPLAGSNGFYDATTDGMKICEWFAKNPNCNIGFCPADAGLTVVDLDPGAQPEQELSETYTVKTPRGSHRYYEGIGPSTAGKIGPHIDTRSIGGYVLLPGSQINGQRYEVINNRACAPLPQWIADKLKKSVVPAASSVKKLDLPQNIERARARLVTYVERGDVAVVGRGGDDRIFRLCCEMYDLGVSADTARELLKEIYIPYCTPSHASDEWLDEKFRNAQNHKQNEDGAYAIEPPAVVFKGLAEKLADKASELREKYRGVKPSIGATRPKAVFWDKEKTFPRYPAGSRILVQAKYSQHKTNLFLAKCLDAMQDHGARVLTATGESADEFLTERIPAQCAARGIAIESLDENLIVAEVCPRLTVPAEVDAFIEEHRAFAPNIVVIDTLSEALTGQDENSAAVASFAMAEAGRIRKAFKAEVILVHHEGKNGQKGARGSSVFAAGADAVWKITYNVERGIVTQFVEKMKRGKAKFSVLWGTKIFDETMTVVPLDAVAAAAMSKAANAPVRDTNSALRQQVKGALYDATKRDVMALDCRQVAGHLNRDATAADRERLIENSVKRIQRAVKGTKTKTGVLSDLVQLDTTGEPVNPYRLFLSERLQAEMEDEEEGGDDE